MKKINDELEAMVSKYLGKLEEACVIFADINLMIKYLLNEDQKNSRYLFMYIHATVSDARLNLLIEKAKRLKEACDESFDPINGDDFVI